MKDYKYLNLPGAYHQLLLHTVRTEGWPAVMRTMLEQHELKEAYPRLDFIRMRRREQLPAEADHLDWLAYWSDIYAFVTIINRNGRLTSRDINYLKENFFERHPIWSSYRKSFHHYKDFHSCYNKHERLRFYLLFLTYQQQKRHPL